MKKEITVNTSAVYEPQELAKLVGLANEFSSKVFIVMENRQVNVKSIMGIMAFNPSEGMPVVIMANGSDEDAAVNAIEKFLICK